jgi:hypothetical protein
MSTNEFKLQYQTRKPEKDLGLVGILSNDQICQKPVHKKDQLIQEVCNDARTIYNPEIIPKPFPNS